MVDLRRLQTDPAATAVLRVLDACANRAMEGLRVVEDYVRFVLDDRHLTEGFKDLRHQLSDVLREVSPNLRARTRDTLGDVGTETQTEQEYFRRSAHDVAAASLERLKQSLRSLEEYAKVLDAGLGARFEQLRYRVYTLEKAVLVLHDSKSRLSQVRLYVLIDGQPPLEEFRQRIERILDGGVDAIQFRDKQLADRQLVARAREARDIVAARGALFIVNDRPDVARLAQADGVHVGQDELTPAQVRSVCGPGILVGVSTHSLAQATQAVLDGADYLGVGPTFASKTKSFSELAGLPFVEAVARQISLPAFAIGGIGPENLDQVLQTGIRRIAVSHAVWGAADPEQAARQLRQRLDATEASRGTADEG